MENIKFLTVVINGEDYSIPKPKPVQMIALEDGCVDKEGKFNEKKYVESILRLLDPKLKSSDLVKFVGDKVTLSTGAELTPHEIGYGRFQLAMEKLGDSPNRVLASKMYLEACGTELEVNDLEYDDIQSMSKAFYELYDEKELAEVVEQVATFR